MSKITKRPHAGRGPETKWEIPVKTIVGRGPEALVDTRPAERDGPRYGASGGRTFAPAITWTEFYAKEDVYSRIDYIFLSRGMAREWDASGTYIFTRPDWGEASDHRPLVAGFVVKENTAAK